MRVSGVHVFSYTLPLSTPLFLKGAEVSERRGLLVRVTADDGTEGWGEAAPLPGFSRETFDEAAAALCAIAASWPGQPLPVPAALPDDLCPNLTLAPSARYGMEQALLAASGRGLTAWTPGRPLLPVSGLLTGDSAFVLSDAERLRAEGYRCVKLKVGRRPLAEDARLVREVRRLMGPAPQLRLDANRAWDLPDAVSFARMTAAYDIAFVEEPLADPDLLPALFARCRLPVALDETLAERGVAAFDDFPDAVAVVMKPTLLGGFCRTRSLMEAAEKKGMVPVLSAAYESGVGLQGIVALAAMTRVTTAAGLDTYRRLAADVFEERLPLSGPEIDVMDVCRTDRAFRREMLTLITP